MAEVYWIHLPEHTNMFSEGYIGFTSKTATERFKEHCNPSSSSSCHVLHSAILKYSPEALIVDVVCICDNEYGLWLESRLRPLPCIGWNIAVGGMAPMLGRTHSAEARKKLSVATKGAAARTGREKAANTLRGIPRDPEMIKRCVEKRVITQAAKTKDERDAPYKLCRPSADAVRNSVAVNTLKPFWDKPASNKGFWACFAIPVCSRLRAGETSSSIAKSLCVPKSQLKKISSLVEAGWFPENDREFMQWREKFSSHIVEGTQND